MKKIILSLVLLTAFIFQSCKEVKELKCTGISKFKLNSISTEAIDADINLKINNPNSSGFKIGKSEFDVSYNGIKIGKAKLVKSVKIKGNAESDYTFKLQTTFKNVVTLDNVMALLQAVNTKGSLNVKGDLNVSKALVKKKFPISYTQSISAD